MCYPARVGRSANHAAEELRAADGSKRRARFGGAGCETVSRPPDGRRCARRRRGSWPRPDTLRSPTQILYPQLRRKGAGAGLCCRLGRGSGERPGSSRAWGRPGAGRRATGAAWRNEVGFPDVGAARTHGGGGAALMDGWLIATPGMPGQPASWPGPKRVWPFGRRGHGGLVSSLRLRSVATSQQVVAVRIPRRSRSSGV